MEGKCCGGTLFAGLIATRATAPRMAQITLLLMLESQKCGSPGESTTFVSTMIGSTYVLQS